MSDSTSVYTYPNMREAYLAIVVIGNLARCTNGRRRQRLEMEARALLHTPDPTNNARRVKIAPRAERRAKLGELRAGYAARIVKDGGAPPKKAELRAKFPFRAVLNHAPTPKVTQADAIAHLYTIDHDKAQEWAEKQAAARLPKFEIVNKTETVEETAAE